MPNTERIETLISPEALKQFETLKTLADANTSSFEKLVAKAVELNKAVGNASTFKDLNKATAEMAKTEAELTKKKSELQKQQEKLNDLFTVEAQKLAQLKAAQAEQRKALKDQANETLGLTDAYKKLELEYNKAAKEAKNLAVQFGANSKEAQEASKRALELDQQLKAADASVGRFNRNVGNYGGALKTLEGYLGDVRKQLQETQQAAQSGLKINIPTAPDSGAIRAAAGPLRSSDAPMRQVVAYTKATAEATEKVEQLRKQEELLSRIVNSQIAGFASATAEIKSNEKALQALGAAGLQHTEFYKVLLKDTADLKDNVGDLKDEIKALASDTREFDLVAGAVTGLVNALQVGASAAELFAGENEDVQKSIQRLIALQNISQGIQQIANDLTTKGTALNKLYNFIIGDGVKTRTAATVATTTNTVATEANTVATEAAAVATTGLSTATKVLRGALIASGIGLLIAGVVYLVTKLQEWREADFNLIKRQAELNQVTLETIRINKELADLTRTDFGTNIQGIKNKIAANQAYGRSQGEVLAAEKELLKVQQDAANIEFFRTGGESQAGRLKADLDAAAKALKDFNEQQAAINPSDRDEKTAAAQRELLQSNYDLAKQSFTDQKKIVDDYYNFNNEAAAKQLQIDRLNADERRKFELQSATISANTIIDSNQRILNNEATTLKQRLALIQSSAEQQKRIARAQDRDVQNDPGASTNDRLMSARNLTYQVNRIEKDSQEAQRKVREDYRKRDLAAALQYTKQRIEDQIKAADLIAQNENKSFDERTDALFAGYEKRRDIIVAQHEFDIKNDTLTAEERIAIEQKFLSDINTLTIDYGLQQQAIYQQNTEKVNEIIAKGQQGRLDKISAQQSLELIALTESFRRGNISAEEYARERSNIEQRYRIISLKEEVNNATAKVLATKEGTDARFAAEKELAEKTLALNDEVTAKQIAADQKLADLKKQLAADTFDTISALQGAQFDKEAALIQEQIDAIEYRKEKDIAAANATLINKEEREKAITKIEAQAQTQRENLERRQRQIELERARFEKAANIAQIIASTAAAVIEALKTYKGTPQAFAVAASIGTIGALQLARAIATPLPKFAEGTTDAPGGLAWVGDAFRKELVVTPQGQVIQTPAAPTVMNVPKHSIVLPDARAALESGLSVNRYGRLMQNDSGSQKIEQKLDHIAKVIRSKPVLNMSADQGGLTAMWNYGANWVTYIEDQTSF